MNAPNRNLLWATIFVDEIVKNGLQSVCLAPGSRNTPLVMAFAAHPDIRVYSHIDERSAAFFALGLALASDKPVALLCSSGTATANFYPAIIEAHYARVPLIVLTADRPPELRDSGANQTVDQVKMYYDHVLWSVDVALPEAQPAAVTLRSLRTLAARAYATANGLPKGAVHLNFPFRKPLEPIEVPTDNTTIPDATYDGSPFTVMMRGKITTTDEQITRLAEIVRGADRGLIFCGSRAGDGAFAEAVVKLAQAAGYPMFADPLSNVRFHADERALILGAYDTFLRARKDWQPPQVIIQFGGMPASQALDDYLNSDKVKHHILISADGVWTDANHRVNHFVWTDPADVCQRLAARLGNDAPNLDAGWIDRFAEAEQVANLALETMMQETVFDGGVVADVVDLLPDDAVIFIANSLPVRHLDQFAKPNNKGLIVYGNRGASGIDGTISSALGASAAHPDRPLVLITGDLAFYHDLNGLLAIKRCGVKTTIVVINNDGGGIFYRLPVAQFDPPFTELFVTPHGLDFEPVTRMYGLEFTRVLEREAFRGAFLDAIRSETATVIELPTDAKHDDATRKAIIQRTAEILHRLPISE
jgi:2-succinyl-5-enolpyruvyl-6-hydroxy-3-cyclohexene-1-carboxylate synthase